MTFFTIVVRGLLRRPVRTGLTLVGISIGIAAVVALVGLASGYGFAIASEGTYRPSAPLFSGHQNAEIIALVGADWRTPITEILLDCPSNFANITIGLSSYRSTGFWQFLDKTGFPEHALMVVPHNEVARELIFKGIRSFDALGDAIERCIAVSETGLAHVEADMRAHMNPTRMKAIATLAERFAYLLSHGGYVGSAAEAAT